MTDPTGLTTADRLLTFEIGDGVYAVPIGDVAEVTGLARIVCIPTVPLRIAGVINHHGDALPVLHRDVLFDVEGGELPEPGHLLVLTEGVDDAGRLGLPVDRILGLVDGVRGTPRGDHPIAERRSVDGRIVNVLDTRRLLRRAVELIEAAVLGTAATIGGET